MMARQKNPSFSFVISSQVSISHVNIHGWWRGGKYGKMGGFVLGF
jgi:hypothetical protein